MGWRRAQGKGEGGHTLAPLLSVDAGNFALTGSLPHRRYKEENTAKGCNTSWVGTAHQFGARQTSLFPVRAVNHRLAQYTDTVHCVNTDKAVASIQMAPANKGGTAQKPVPPSKRASDAYKEVYGWEHASRVMRLSIFSLLIFMGSYAILGRSNKDSLSVRKHTVSSRADGPAAYLAPPFPLQMLRAISKHHNHLLFYAEGGLPWCPQTRLGYQAANVFGIQWLAFTFAALCKTERFYDMFGTGTFIYVAWVSRQHALTTPRPTTRVDTVTALVLVWGLRLGGYLMHRIHKDGHDKRFDQVKGNPVMFFIYWTLQGMWVFVTTLPVSVLSLRPEGWDAPRLQPNDQLGIAVWAFGFLVESLADWQKSSFRADPANKGEYIRTGLWRYCRHPNCIHMHATASHPYCMVTNAAPPRRLPGV